MVLNSETIVKSKAGFPSHRWFGVTIKRNVRKRLRGICSLYLTKSQWHMKDSLWRTFLKGKSPQFSFPGGHLIIPKAHLTGLPAYLPSTCWPHTTNILLTQHEVHSHRHYFRLQSHPASLYSAVHLDNIHPTHNACLEFLQLLDIYGYQSQILWYRKSTLEHQLTHLTLWLKFIK